MLAWAAAERTGDERRMIRRARVWPRALPFQQFHVLFNSLFKVLFIFRSLYLCAIGLWPVFSLRRHIPPALSSIPKLLDSPKELYRGCGVRPDGALTLCGVPFQGTRKAPRQKHPLQITTRAPRRGGTRFQIWAAAASLAVTGAIPVGFFSSAY
ncbi:hypothetical protein LSTR_LSTR016343 [Laodelphax striatellus]|uniref:Uncharacterized protein n=1 Tax=Laodelphax striatellus TaxID=195883 RepID=A0A482WZY1_LAOST|nr:hypothetical protein LSTR_LSTR016343 [Laodelphax striatellus]